MKYNLVEHNGSRNITVETPDGKWRTAVDSHPNFDAIIEAARNDDQSIADLFDISVAVAKKFDRLSERVTVAHGEVYFDGELMHNALTKAIVRFLDEKVDDFKPLVAFFEKVMQNPQEHSREQLYSWLEKHNFTIADDGDFYAYKGVRRVSDDTFCSINSGNAIVDGETHTGTIPQKVGSVVEMPRGNVAHNPSEGCSTGLHAGTFAYASGFTSGPTLYVKINPRDVVSVPTDSNQQKLRVCRYNVVKVIEQEYIKPLYFDSEDDAQDTDWNDICDCDDYNCDCDF